MKTEAQELANAAAQQLEEFVGSITGKVADKRMARDKSLRDAADMRRQIEAKQAKLVAIEEKLAAQEKSLSELDGVEDRVLALKEELAGLQAAVGDRSEERVARMSEIWKLLEVERDDVMRIFYGKAK